MTYVTKKHEPILDTYIKKDHSKPCHYFRKGFCGFGEKCSYKHSKPKKSSDVEICRFYKRASCKFASKCWNKHIGPNGKEYPKPGPFNKFIVVGPSGEEPIQTKGTPIGDFAVSPSNLADKVEKRRCFRRPRNQVEVSKKCFYYEENGRCYYEDNCWYNHTETYVRPEDELLYEANQEPEPEMDPDHTKMCYNFIFTECEFGDECPYVHGDICQFCDLPFLHPFDEQQRNDHLEACEMFFREDMDNAFKFMVSKDKMCVICLEYIWGPDKLFTKQKFGIQEKCNHIFCLSCIRRWREVKWKSKEPQVCPACRKVSRLVVPCARWFESEGEKEQWIKSYEAAVTQKPCKFYAKGKCRKEDKCIYFHAEFIIPVVEIGGLGDYWENFESNIQLPSGELDGPDSLLGENVISNQDQQVAEWRNFQEQESLHDSPPENQIIENTDLQIGEQLRFEERGSLGSLKAENVISNQDQESLHDSPPENQIIKNIDLQLGDQLPLEELGSSDSLSTENVISNQDQQVAERINFQEQESLHDSPPENQIIENTDLQPGEHAVRFNLTSENQLFTNLERVNLADDGSWQYVSQVPEDPNFQSS